MRKDEKQQSARGRERPAAKQKALKALKVRLKALQQLDAWLVNSQEPPLLAFYGIEAICCFAKGESFSGAVVWCGPIGGLGYNDYTRVDVDSVFGR